VDAVRTRAPGETVLAAFARFILARQGVMQDTERLRTVTRVITESPALLARERQVLDHYASALARVLAEETGDDSVAPLVAAYALIGLHRSLIEHVRRRVLDGATAPAISRSVRAEAERGVALLERGLGGQDPC
jgi:hypothetical protein